MNRDGGLDVKLGARCRQHARRFDGAVGALGALVMFSSCALGFEMSARRCGSRCVYAFGTPIFFRSAFLNQNAIITHAVLVAYVLLVGLAAPRTDSADNRRLQPETQAMRSQRATLAAGATAGSLHTLRLQRGRARIRVRRVVHLARDGDAALELRVRWPAMLMAGHAGPLVLLLLFATNGRHLEIRGFPRRRTCHRQNSACEAGTAYVSRRRVSLRESF